MVLETAVNGRADMIVTFNTRDFTGPSAQFGIAVVAPGVALREWEKRP
jgi:predicted nucleic acid-binding protein